MISKGVRTIKLAPTQQTSSSSKMPFGRPGSKGSSTQGDPEDPTKLLGFLGHEKTLGQMKRGQQSLNTSHLDEVSQLYWKSVRQGWPAPHSVYNDGIPQGWMQESLKILPKTVHRIAEQVKFVTDMDVRFYFCSIKRLIMTRLFALFAYCYCYYFFRLVLDLVLDLDLSVRCGSAPLMESISARERCNPSSRTQSTVFRSATLSHSGCDARFQKRTRHSATLRSSAIFAAAWL